MNITEIVEQWLIKVDDDIFTAVHMFEDVYPKKLEICCFHCQQAVEKILKGYLIYNGIEPPKIHDLLKLCLMCIEKDAAFNVYLNDCKRITLYVTRTCYPEGTGVTEYETKTAIKNTKAIINFTLERIPELKDKYQIKEVSDDA
ncbi:MAG: HEPN domain-containing protein [Oscillospiraceae bacterium]|jgi:HEPN domain-containing protein|nr:HEPN domain-containing protein [Oscillospiraceae bacterium]